MKKHIPNLITCLNLFSGCIAVVFAFQNDLKLAAYFVFLAALLDFLDGFIARLLKSYSEIGKQLDSLADMVSFGLVPGIVLFQYLQNSNGITENNNFLAFGGFIITVFSALRLAKFNLDTRQSDQFIGLPTPANALFIVSLIFVFEKYPTLFEQLNVAWFFAVITILFSYLLVAELPLLALKFKSFTFKNNELPIALLISSAVLILLFTFAAIPIIIILYILLSLIKPKKHEIYSRD